MKKTIASLLILTICLFLFTACGKTDNEESTADEAHIATADEATIAQEDFRADNEFTGDYENDEYTAHIVKDSNDELNITISSSISDKKSYTWTMSGYLSDISYKVIYDNCVKTLVNYNSQNEVKNRETEYENGSGKIIFNDNNGFTWSNGMENIENNEFTKIK